jgi:hypothetical protein
VKERYEVEPERLNEVVRLNVRAATRKINRYGFRWINVGDHWCAVLVLGVDQAEADTRAAAIVAAMNNRAGDGHSELSSVPGHNPAFDRVYTK